MEQDMDEIETAPVALPPMTDEEGEDYARQETLDGQYATTDTNH